VPLSFPNLNRSYDPERRRVRFWAHDSAMEIPFFLNESALLRLNPKAARTEAAMLATFDANRERINAVAGKIHAFDRRSFHVLEAGDFP
jgi:hypothetical protein